MSIAGWLHQVTGTILGADLIAGHGVRDGKAMIATLRHRLIEIPARPVRHAGRLILGPAPPGYDTSCCVGSWPFCGHLPHPP